MFNNDSDEGEVIEEDHEAKWRQERFEREKFLQEQEASSPLSLLLGHSPNFIDLNTLFLYLRALKTQQLIKENKGV